MLRIQIVGLPQTVHRRVKQSLIDWRGTKPMVDIRLAPSHHDRLALIGDPEVSQAQRNAEEGFTHLAVVPARQLSTIERIFRFDCRVIHLNLQNNLLAITWDELKAQLERIIDFENRWCDVVRPNDLNHPLLLPAISFECDRSVGNFWRACDCYADTSKLTAANNALQAVHAIHRHRDDGGGRCWVDASRRRFAIDRSGHGRSPNEREGRRRFRFCYEIPPGFHYDVIHIHGTRFTLAGLNGHYPNVYRANVDPWSSVRIP